MPDFDAAHVQPCQPALDSGPYPRRGLSVPGTIDLTVYRCRRGTVVVQVAGELDLATAPRWESAVLAELGPSVRTVLVDLEHVSFFGVSGLVALLNIDDAVRQVGARLRLMSPSPAVRRPLDLVGLTARFELSSRTAAP